jgi:hypothetical protein
MDAVVRAAAVGAVRRAAAVGAVLRAPYRKESPRQSTGSVLFLEKDEGTELDKARQAAARHVRDGMLKASIEERRCATLTVFIQSTTAELTRTKIA